MVIDDENQLVVMVAVHDLDVHSGVAHRLADRAELARNVLSQTLEHNGGDQLFVADETALPALGAILEARPADAGLAVPRAIRAHSA